MGAERDRLEGADAVAWRRWGPYLSERAWGTVREDYSAGGDAWSFFPHDHARSRVYRWNEDGLCGLSDREQFLCFALSMWNGQDPILKERIFGLAGPQGNHGEDPKEYWWYLDSTPTHSWMRWRYMYSQREFPYADLAHVNGHRGRHEPEYELLDTGVFDDDRYFEITADIAKATPEDMLIELRVRNAGPDEATLDLLPTIWFRNTWSWGRDDRRPSLSVSDDGTSVIGQHHRLGRFVLTGDGEHDLLFCENETNTERIFGTPSPTPFPKDGINDHVVSGAKTVNPERSGTKAALRYRLVIPAGETATVRLRLSPEEGADLGNRFAAVLEDRRAEADEFYDELTPNDATPDEALVMRQAFGGMLWTKQFYHYNIADWLDGDPAGPPPPESRKHGRNAHWRHMDNFDVVSMPDKWEYPWYAVWDSAFHCVTLAHVDAEFAKDQLLLFLREWYLHPNGQIPAYEWNFGDVNPPVHAWSALRVFEIDGSRDFAFLSRVFQKLLLNFTWWVNQKDLEGNDVFEGGFLGLDNIGPIDRSSDLPPGLHLEQSDGTAWMAMYALDLCTMALVLAEHDPAYEDIASKFFEHFSRITVALNASSSDGGLWDRQDGFFYDVLHVEHAESVPLRVRSMVGLSPLYAARVMDQSLLEKFPGFATRRRWYLKYRVRGSDLRHLDDPNEKGELLLSVVGTERLRRILHFMLDENEFLSPHGLRALSAVHRHQPLSIDVRGFHAAVGYEPAESLSPMFGGNSNWRGPIWFPVNFLLLEALRNFARYAGDGFTIEHPTGSGQERTLQEVHDDLANRLISIFLEREDGRRPVFGGVDRMQNDPAWHDHIPFHEYFHGDDGAGLGAPHQTGWTGLVANLITERRWR
jgi:hypothetical protein